MSRWQARSLRRVTRVDAAAIALLLSLAIATVVSGRQARLGLTPRSAQQVAGMLDQLELPTRLPDAPLLDASGEATTLLARIHEKRAAVAFYAPWWGPRQKERPTLAAAIANDAQLLVCRLLRRTRASRTRSVNSLDLGLGTIWASMWTRPSRLFREGRVTALPTTFLITRSGSVLARGAGVSRFSIQRLHRKASSSDTADSSEQASEPEGGAP